MVFPKSEVIIGTNKLIVKCNINVFISSFVL